MIDIEVELKVEVQIKSYAIKMETYFSVYFFFQVFSGLTPVIFLLNF